MANYIRAYDIQWSINVLEKEYPRFWKRISHIKSLDDVSDATPIAQKALSNILKLRESCPSNGHAEMAADPFLINDVIEAFNRNYPMRKAAEWVGIPYMVLRDLRKLNKQVDKAYLESKQRRRMLDSRRFRKVHRETTKVG